jgi:thiosulfate/3-mercaptopyruvate sulfurtransferase
MASAGDTSALMLIQAIELAQLLAKPEPAVRVADVRWYLNQPGRRRREYESGHIPGAIFVDLDSDLADPNGLGSPGRHPLPDPAAFAHRLGELGIGDEHLVVAYDDAGGTIAARLWWMLDDLGHRDVRILDGGIQGWTTAGNALTTEEPRWPTAELHLASSWQRAIGREAVAAQLGSATLLDARAGERYRGEVEPVDPVPGHIPTAISVPTGGNLGPDGRFLPANELAARYRAIGAGADAASPVITSCGSGVTACHTALAMRIAGLPDPLLYPGSFSEWSRAGLPVASGPEPGARPSAVARSVRPNAPEGE